MKENIEEVTNEIFMTLPHAFYNFIKGFRNREHEHGLSEPQARILLILKDFKKMNMTEITRHLAMEKSTFSRIAFQLEEMGLIQRERDRDDRRQVFLSLTEDGEELVKELEKKAMEFVQEKLKKLSIEDIYEMNRALKVLSKTMEKID